jgi:hypothetical protein
MAQVRPFRSESSPDQLADLRERLTRTRFAPALSGQAWTHGTPPGYLAELLEYWRDKFDWSTAEDRLNALPQFLVEVNGNTLHFVWAKGAGPRPFPLLRATAHKAATGAGRLPAALAATTVATSRAST